jgi:hypothetical protein
MKIIRTPARLFEHLLPLIKEQESAGLKYLRDENDGSVGGIGVNATCTKRVYFDDGKSEVSFQDRTVTKP